LGKIGLGGSQWLNSTVRRARTLYGLGGVLEQSLGVCSLLADRKFMLGRSDLLIREDEMMKRMTFDRFRIGKSAKLIGLLSVFAIGVLCSKPADASFLIDAASLSDGNNGVKFILTDSTSIDSASQLALLSGFAEPTELLYRIVADGTGFGGLPIPALQAAFKGSATGFLEVTDFDLKNLSQIQLVDRTEPLYLVVKDGTEGAPRQYVIDLTVFESGGVKWDGLAEIQGRGFWLDGVGTVTQVSLWGTQAVPEPASVALVGFGVFCFACGPLRRRMRKTAGVAQAA